MIQYFKSNENNLDTNLCYKNKKNQCNDDEDCYWLFESKFQHSVLVERLKMFDLLTNDSNKGNCDVNGKKIPYDSCSVVNLIDKLRNTYNMKHLTSRCIKKTKNIINNYELIIFRNVLNDFYFNNKDTIELEDDEKNILDNLVNSFISNKKSTNSFEFKEYTKNKDTFIKILKNIDYLSTILNDICANTDYLNINKTDFIDNLFNKLQTYDLPDLQKLKSNICNNNNQINQNNLDSIMLSPIENKFDDSDDDDELSLNIDYEESKVNDSEESKIDEKQEEIDDSEESKVDDSEESKVNDSEESKIDEKQMIVFQKLMKNRGLMIVKNQKLMIVRNQKLMIVRNQKLIMKMK